MRAEELGALLNAHAYLRVERPPLLWALAADLEKLIHLLGEMIAAGLARNGGALSEIILNVSNVTVDPAAAESMPTGDFIAITIRGRGDWGPEVTWRGDEAGKVPFLNDDLETAAIAAAIPYGYTRVLADDEGSVTVFLARRTD